MQHGHRQRPKGNKLTLRDKDDPGHRENQHQRKGHEPVHRAIDQPVLHQQQGDLRIHGNSFVEEAVKPNGRDHQLAVRVAPPAFKLAAGLRSGLVFPGTVLDLDHHPSALVQTQMVIR